MEININAEEVMQNHKTIGSCAPKQREKPARHNKDDRPPAVFAPTAR